MFTYPIIEAGAGVGSEFEEAIDALSPLVFHKFRDENFTTNIEDNSGNANHLVKQTAAATRDSTVIRTTHPGGAYFPAVTYDNWGTTGTPYEGPTGLLASESEATLILSARVNAPKSSGTIARLFGVAEPDAAEGGTNDIFVVHDDRVDGTLQAKHTTTTGAQGVINTLATGEIADGVNRLFIFRYKDDVAQSLTTSKPGHEALLEETAGASSGTGLSATARTLLMNGRNDTGLGAATTTDFVVDAAALLDIDIGDAAELNLHSLWQAENSGAGYYPSMMQFDGSTGYYGHDAAFTTSGNLVTCVMRFNRASFTGDKLERMVRIRNSSNHIRVGITAYSSDWTSDTNRQDTIQVVTQDDTASNIAILYSPDTYLDGEDHVLFYAFDGDNGTAVFRIDGVDADDTGNASRSAPTTGTLGSGASSDAMIGSANPTAASDVYSGEIGFFGYRDAYLTNYSDFSNASDATLPAVIDEKGWWQWDGRSAGDFGMTEFDGSGDWYTGFITASGNKTTTVLRFNHAAWSADEVEGMFRADGASGRQRAQLTAFGGGYTADANKAGTIQFAVIDSSGADACRLFTPTGYFDGNDHVIFASFDGDAGTAVFKIDGVDVDDTGNASRTAPTTATLAAASGSAMTIAAANAAGVNPYTGSIGFVGHHSGAYLTNDTDFSTGSTPLDIDEINWTEWGSQPDFWNRVGDGSDNKGGEANLTANGSPNSARPLFWSHTGDMVLNKGTAGAMTKNGTITYTVGGSP